MIPTSATSSSPPIASVGSIGSNQMNNSPNIPGTANTNNGTAGTSGSGMGAGAGGGGGSIGQANISAFLGIASLILEGRALANDEYAPQTTRHELKSLLSGNTIASDCGRQSPKPSTSRAAFGDNYGGSGSTTTTTTNAMSNSFSIDLANYLGRKSSNSPDTTSSSSFLRDYYNSSSGESAASSVESNHSRWSQKLSQLRQESPNAHHQILAARQKIAVECARGSEAEYVALAINTEHQGGGGLNDERRGGDFEILRRMSINQMNFYNSPNSMGSMGGSVSGGGGSSENFMCSLQSLASNTCLRVGNPLLATTTSPPRYSNNRQISSSSTPRFSTPSHQQQQQQQQLEFSPNSSNSSSGSSANSWYPATSSPPQMANSGSSSNNNKDYLLRKTTTATAAAVTTQRMPIPSATPIPAANNKSSLNTTNSQISHSNIFNRNSFTTNSNNAATASGAAGATTIATSTPSATATQRNQTYPQQGPHCDQFLRKMGLAKGDALETEEHHCDMSYVNITCTRWRAYCIKMENILARGEPICIEVYLGPVGHKILLEQWIITQKDKQPPPTMTLPSLCSAIRSQLYFSQISAWCDLIKKSDKTIYETGRVIYTTPPTTSAAGDLATTNNVIQMQTQTSATLLTTSTQQQQQHQQHTTVITPSTSSSSAGVGTGVSGGVGCNKRRSSSAPRLNIFYRIKQYDSTACFNSKPNVHNFPNVNITENCSISVCLKSLPRITGGIPKVGIIATQQQISPSAATTTTTTPAAVNSLTAKNKSKTTDIVIATASSAVANLSATVATTTTTTNANKSTILTMNCDNNLKELQQQKTLTASSRCSFSQNRKNSKTSTTTTSQLEHNLKDREQQQQQSEEDIDLEYEEHNIDLNAGGGDNSNISASSSLMAGNSGCGDGDVGGNSVGDCDSSNSSFSTNNYGNLSHREKQLLKYRKRMMKRDKKQQLRKTNEITLNKLQNDNKMEQGENDIYDDNDEEEDVDKDVNDGDKMKHVNKLNNVNDGNNSDNTADYKELIKYSINTKLAKGQRQQQQLPNNHINNNSNSIPCTITTATIQNQQQHVKMISTGTQTITNTCTSCGSEKSMICLKCNPFKTTKATTTTTSTNALYNYDEEIMDAETSSSSSSSSSANSLSSSDIIHTPRNKAELLLQAIQRTPKSNKKHKHKSKDSQQQQQQKQMAAIKQHQQHSPSSSTTPLIDTNIKINRKSSPNSPQLNGNSSNNSNNLNNGVASNTNNSRNININNSNSSNNSNNITMIGCQVCKRQKTQHHFNQSSMIEELSSSDDNNSLANSSFNSSSNAIDVHQALITTANQNPTSASADGCGTADGDEEDGDNEKDGGSILSNDCVDNISFVIDKHDDEQLHENGVERKMSETKSLCDDFNEHEIMEEEYFETSTKLTPHIDRCSLNNKTYYEQLNRSNAINATDTIEYQTRSCSTPPLVEQTTNVNGCSSNSNETTAMMAQFKTPTPSEQQHNAIKNKAQHQQQQQQQPLQHHKNTPKPNLLHIACNFNKNDEQHQQQHQQISKLNHMNTMDNNTPTTSHNPLLLRRSLPKVNLTPIFCNPNSTMMVVSSSPIPIGNGVSNGSSVTNGLISKSAEINITQASPTFSFESPSSPAPSLTVQKSNSAPTLPNSPSLSPRFFKASAIYKRRSRHLSDRSDRSSLGSDEQFSDEDIDSGMYSPFATSPVKLRTRLAAVFGRKPLLGNLEECLLQRRLVPKIEVMGFKLLLGASGGFCPTQLTIPAAAYFYELKGETLSTPYLCEIRLPRKGYTVPRCGTVQATLLNPMGTVVRMFVIPYDMRDMPTLHQTFIRQRILADSGVQSNNNDEGVKENGIGNDKHFDVDLTTKPQSQDLGQQYQNTKQQQQQQNQGLNQQQQQRSPQCNNENNLGHFISAENMKSLRYSIHLRFQTSRSGRLMLHTDIRLLISRRTDCDTAAAHAKGVLEAPNELITNTVMPTNPKYSARQDQTSSKI